MFGLAKFLITMAFERGAASVGLNRAVEIDLAAFQLADDLFELLERRFETLGRDIVEFFSASLAPESVFLAMSDFPS